MGFRYFCCSFCAAIWPAADFGTLELGVDSIGFGGIGLFVKRRELQLGCVGGHSAGWFRDELLQKLNCLAIAIRLLVQVGEGQFGQRCECSIVSIRDLLQAGFCRAGLTQVDRCDSREVPGSLARFK